MVLPQKPIYSQHQKLLNTIRCQSNRFGCVWKVSKDNGKIFAWHGTNGFSDFWCRLYIGVTYKDASTVVLGCCRAIELNARNTLFLHLLCWNPVYARELVDSMLKSMFMHDPHLHHVAMLKSLIDYPCAFDVSLLGYKRRGGLWLWGCHSGRSKLASPAGQQCIRAQTDSIRNDDDFSI